VGLILLLPFLLAGVAAIVAVVCVRLSTLRITNDGVEVRNYPQAPKQFSLEEVDKFEAAPRVGNFSFLRPATATLVLADGTRVPVRTIFSPDAGHGVDALNKRVDTMRQTD
jgi:hypothetical protein